MYNKKLIPLSLFYSETDFVQQQNFECVGKIIWIFNGINKFYTPGGKKQQRNIIKSSCQATKIHFVHYYMCVCASFFLTVFIFTLANSVVLSFFFALTVKLFRFMCTIIRKYSGGSVDSSAHNDVTTNVHLIQMGCMYVVCVCVSHKLSLHGSTLKTKLNFTQHKTSWLST